MHHSPAECSRIITSTMIRTVQHLRQDKAQISLGASPAVLCSSYLKKIWVCLPTATRKSQLIQAKNDRELEQVQTMWQCMDLITKGSQTDVKGFFHFSTVKERYFFYIDKTKKDIFITKQWGHFSRGNSKEYIPLEIIYIP